jgi:hypothetical protein
MQNLFSRPQLRDYAMAASSLKASPNVMRSSSISPKSSGVSCFIVRPSGTGIAPMHAFGGVFSGNGGTASSYFGRSNRPLRRMRFL